MTYGKNLADRIFVGTGLAIALATIVPVLCFAYLKLSGNFHVVAEGVVYRSAQPSETTLRRYVSAEGIRSILNLRSASGDEDREGQLARQLGLTYFHIPLSAVQFPAASDIENVMKILADAPKPILIHSYFGADRAGLASALYLFRIDGEPASKAASQLSPGYGHFAFLGAPTAAMDQTFQAVVNIHSPQAE
jgi:protein tyrosine/serine phosphatase